MRLCLFLTLSSICRVAAAQAQEAPALALDEIQIVSGRQALLGSSSTASEGVVDEGELALTPQYRPGQLLETVPGLIVTSHSGEGKANQFMMRGYNLDHGTDLATTVDGMPINQPTHAHGQGYIDLNFLVPELVDGLAYTKGPYDATVGDFGAVGSVHLDYRDAMASQVATALGGDGFRRVFAVGSTRLETGQGRLLAAAEVQHYDGPFAVPDNAAKQNAVLRWSDGTAHEGASLTAMYYEQDWNSTTDIPWRAVQEGVVADRFGSLDPSDGGHARRASLSGQWHHALEKGSICTSAYVIDSQLHMYNDFTHFLVDPVHGDQEDQFEYRLSAGGAADYQLDRNWGPLENQFRLGVALRHDQVHLGRLPSQNRMPLSLAQVESTAQADPASFLDDDQVRLLALAVYAQATTYWSDRWRSIVGWRLDDQRGTDTDSLAWLHQTAGYTNGGSVHQALLQPKFSLVYNASDRMEMYLSGGEGFHSADLRGVNQDAAPALGLPKSPLLARQWGEELGVRGAPRPATALTLSVFHLWQQSETILDPDAGQDTAGPPSRRFGVEATLTHQISRRLELYGSYSVNHARFTSPLDDGTGHVGTLVANAPLATGNLSLIWNDAGPWSGGLNFRYLGRYALSSGPCQDAAARRDFPGVATACANAPTAPGQVDGRGFGQWNIDIHYRPDAHWTTVLGIYNLFNAQAAAAQFWYVDRLHSEIAAYPQGRADLHQHPLEPRMLRASLIWAF